MELNRHNVRNYIHYQGRYMTLDLDYDARVGRWFWAMDTAPSPLEAFAGDISQACLRIAHERASTIIEERYPLTLALVRRIAAAGRFPSAGEKALIRDMDAVRQQVEREEYQRAKNTAFCALQRGFENQGRASA